MSSRATQIAIRVDQADAELADHLAEELAKATLGGIRPTRTTVCREALSRGLRSMKAELDEKTRTRR